MSKKPKKSSKAKPLKGAQKYLEPRDTGSPLAILRKAELIGDRDLALAENPASVLFAKGIISQAQHRAAHLFGAFHERVWGRPDCGVGRYDALIAGELRSLFTAACTNKEDCDCRDCEFKRSYNSAKATLDICDPGAVRLTLDVCIYGILPPAVLQPSIPRELLLIGLRALVDHFGGEKKSTTFRYGLLHHLNSLT